MSVRVRRSASEADLPLEPFHAGDGAVRPTLHKPDAFRSRHPGVLERFLAGLVVIGLLLWGASILATPDPPSSPDLEPKAQVLPPLDEPAPREGAADDDGDEADGERKGKKGRDPDG